MTVRTPAMEPAGPGSSDAPEIALSAGLANPSPTPRLRVDVIPPPLDAGPALPVFPPFATPVASRPRPVLLLGACLLSLALHGAALAWLIRLPSPEGEPAAVEAVSVALVLDAPPETLQPIAGGELASSAASPTADPAEEIPPVLTEHAPAVESATVAPDRPETTRAIEPAQSDEADVTEVAPETGVAEEIASVPPELLPDKPSQSVDPTPSPDAILPIEETAARNDPVAAIPDRLASDGELPLPESPPLPTQRPEPATADAQPQPRRAEQHRDRIERRTTPTRQRAGSSIAHVAAPERTVQQPKPRASSTGARQASRDARRGAASAGAEASFGRRLLSHVERHKRYPAQAQRQRLTGATRLSITIDRSGRLTGARVTKGSGHAILDGEAMAVAKRAAPYPRPPEGVGGATISFAVTLRFSR